MCFSAEASFAAAGGLALVGAATLARRPAPRMMLLALTPLLFAAHQAIEGFIWLDVEGGAASQPLVKTWVFIAEVFWPAFVPAAIYMMTRGSRRRSGLIALFLTGLAVAAYYMTVLLENDFVVTAVRHNLVYRPEEPADRNLGGLYLLCTTAPLLIARERFVHAFGLTVLAGAVVAQFLFTHAGPSVWCFFAAIASVFAFLAVRDDQAGSQTAARSGTG